MLIFWIFGGDEDFAVGVGWRWNFEQIGAVSGSGGNDGFFPLG